MTKYNPTNLAQLVGGYLATSDKVKGLTRGQIAERFGMSPAYLSMWLKGEDVQKDPRNQIVSKIAKFFGMEPEELLKHSTRLHSVTRSGSTIALQSIFVNNRDCMPEVQAFLDAAGKNIDKKKWRRILNIVNE